MAVVDDGTRASTALFPSPDGLRSTSATARSTPKQNPAVFARYDLHSPSPPSLVNRLRSSSSACRVIGCVVCSSRRASASRTAAPKMTFTGHHGVLLRVINTGTTGASALQLPCAPRPVFARTCLFAIAARALPRTRAACLAVFERLRTLLVIDAPADRAPCGRTKMMSEFLPSPSRRTGTLPQLLLRQNPDHLAALFKRQHASRLASAHAGVVRAEQRAPPTGTSSRPIDMKTPDARKTARSGRSTSKRRYQNVIIRASSCTISRISCDRLLNRVARRIQLHRVACAGRSGAISRSESCLSRAFMSCQNLLVADSCRPSACSSSKRRLGALLRRVRSGRSSRLRVGKHDRPDVAPVHDDVVLPRESAAACPADTRARTAAPTRRRHSGSSPACAARRSRPCPLRIMCCTPSSSMADFDVHIVQISRRMPSASFGSDAHQPHMIADRAVDCARVDI